jgi:hypothetical protein
MNVNEAQKIVRTMDDEVEVPPGEFVGPGTPAIPMNHTTPAALLLKWHSIKTMLKPFLDQEGVKLVDDFPMQQEEKRGTLHVWGRGEGTVLADCWGGIESLPGPIDFGVETVSRLVRSYEDHIQNMHPLIPPENLQAMVTLFLNELYQNSCQMRRGPVATFVQQPPKTGAKRKRTSPGPESPDSPVSTPPPKLGRLSFQRTINNAVVLLVLALGRICEVTGKIPDVVPVSVTYGSPIQRSPPSDTPHSGLPSHRDTSSSHSSSVQTGGTVGTPRVGTSFKRNLDVIPGLDYFAYATDILGGQLAGNSLRHVYAHILAGLYHGQLGRVIESHAHIRQAGLTLYNKMRGYGMPSPSFSRLTTVAAASPLLTDGLRRRLGHYKNLSFSQDELDNQIATAFWTILQLER